MKQTIVNIYSWATIPRFGLIDGIILALAIWLAIKGWPT